MRSSVFAFSIPESVREEAKNLKGLEKPSKKKKKKKKPKTTDDEKQDPLLTDSSDEESDNEDDGEPEISPFFKLDGMKVLCFHKKQILPKKPMKQNFELHVNFV